MNPLWTRRGVLAAPLALTLAGRAFAQATQTTQRAPAAANACPALLNQSFPRLQDEAPQSLCQYAGRVLLVVNTASECGYTPQYEGLERLHARLAPRGLVVLGFPANDFGAQEPGRNDQIAAFCFNTFGVRFPMFGKSSVVGPQANALYRELARRSGQAPRWNFHKYLVDRSAGAVQSFSSDVAPESPVLLAAIERALAAKT
jgi:glutathione peroxidase